MFTATVVAAQTNLSAEPSRNRTPETQLLHGEHMRIHAIKRGWGYGVALNPLDGRKRDYAGWVRMGDLIEQKIAPSHHVTALRAPVFSRPDLKSPIRQFLPLCARFRAAGSAVGNGGEYVQLGGGGFVSRLHVARVGEGVVEDFVDTAESFQGLPYVWGGNGPDGMDCSGLVKLALQTAGVVCPRDADQQEDALGQKGVGKAVRPDSALMNLKRGDLIFWPGHVGVMQTSGRLLHANAWHMRVATEPLREAVERIGAIRSVRRV
jgi:cell wall-associated NlpC family hydrolase